MSGRTFVQAVLDLEKKNQPVGLPGIGMLADDARQVQILGTDGQPQLLGCFTASRNVRRLTLIDVNLSPAGAPETAVRVLRALDQQHFVTAVEAIKQRGDFVWKT